MGSEARICPAWSIGAQTRANQEFSRRHWPNKAQEREERLNIENSLLSAQGVGAFLCGPVGVGRAEGNRASRCHGNDDDKVVEGWLYHGDRGLMCNVCTCWILHTGTAAHFRKLKCDAFCWTNNGSTPTETGVSRVSSPTALPPSRLADRKGSTQRLMESDHRTSQWESESHAKKQSVFLTHAIIWIIRGPLLGGK